MHLKVFFFFELICKNNYQIPNFKQVIENNSLIFNQNFILGNFKYNL